MADLYSSIRDSLARNLGLKHAELDSESLVRTWPGRCCDVSSSTEEDLSPHRASRR